MARHGEIVFLGRLFFAIALIAFGVQQLVFGDFVPGRAPPWPASVPGRLVWAYGSGVLLVAAGVALVVDRWGRWAAILVGTMIFCWALLRHIPIALADPRFGTAWTKLGKALALFGGAFAVGASLPARGDRPALDRFTSVSLMLGRVCLGAFLVSAGIQHFIWVEFVKELVPAWIPGAHFWTYLAGVALIAGGAGLVFPPTVRPAGLLSGLMIFLWVVLLHVPRALSAAPPAARGEWIAVFEALAMSGIALVLAGATPRRSG